MEYQKNRKNIKFSKIDQFSREYEEAKKQVSEINKNEDRKNWLFAKTKAKTNAQFNRLQLIGLLFVYFVAANLIFVDKLKFLDDWDMGINLDYWFTNTTFLFTTVIWFNIFLYSFLPVIIAHLFIKDKIVTWSAYALPINWGYILLRQIEDPASEAEVVVPNISYLFYGITIISFVIVLIRIIILFISARMSESIDEVQRFKEEALDRLLTYNPYVNRKMVKDYLGEQGEAFNLMLAAHLEKNDRKKELLTRLALMEMAYVYGKKETPPPAR